MRQIVVVTLLWLVLVQGCFGQRGAGNSDQNSASGNVAQPNPQPPGDDALARMRDDLNKLESLNLNMSSEIEFLRDQNLQILLRTNSQMWTIVIRDLREQIAREEQRRATSPQTTTARPAR